MPDTSVKVTPLKMPDYSVIFSQNSSQVTFKGHTLSGDFSLSRFNTVQEMFSDLRSSDFLFDKGYTVTENDTTLFVSKKTYLPEKITHTSGDTVIFTEVK